MNKKISAVIMIIGLCIINGKYVLSNLSGDGCGCDGSRYSSTTVIGRIKQWNESLHVR